MTNRKKVEYANAAKVLPEDLYLELTKYFTGNLWVPIPLTAEFKSMEEWVLQLDKEGLTTKEIAKRVDRSPRRINQILNKHNPYPNGIRLHQKKELRLMETKRMLEERHIKAQEEARAKREAKEAERLRNYDPLKEAAKTTENFLADFFECRFEGESE